MGPGELQVESPVKELPEQNTKPAPLGGPLDIHPLGKHGCSNQHIICYLKESGLGGGVQVKRVYIWDRLTEKLRNCRAPRRVA